MAKEKSKPLSFNLRLDSIQVLKSYLSPPSQDLSPNAKIDIRFEVSQATDATNKIIQVVCSAKAILIENEEVVIEQAAAFLFFIDNFDDVIEKDNENKFVIPDSLLITLNSISISTLRGIWYSNLRGTHFHHILLPLIDPLSINRL